MTRKGKITYKDAKEVLSEYCNKAPGLQPDCVAETMPHVKMYIQSFGSDFNAKFPDDDRERVHLVLLQVLHRQITSGQYHFYRGSLTPLGENMKFCFTKILEWALENGIISPNEKEQTMNNLVEDIKIVG